MILLSSVWDGPNISSFFFKRKYWVHPIRLLVFIQCFVLRYQVDQLISGHSGFWHLLVRWILIVKTPLKMLVMDVKNAEKWTRSKYFYDGRFIFNVQIFLTQCAITFRASEVSFFFYYPYQSQTFELKFQLQLQTEALLVTGGEINMSFNW